MQYICSIDIAEMSDRNIAPGMNAAYDNHMECKSHCAIQGLISKINKHIEALLWFKDNIDLSWGLNQLQSGLHKHSRLN